METTNTIKVDEQMYTTLTEVTKTAEVLNFTVGAFNTHNLEMLPEMLRAAKEMGDRSLSKQVSIRQDILG